MVGGDAGLVFSPNTLTAMPGDMVEFTFMSKNHTLTQSTFPEPCKKMKDGVDSGFLPNPDNTISPPPTYVFQVKDAKPVCKTLFLSSPSSISSVSHPIHLKTKEAIELTPNPGFYCKQKTPTSHCGKGMTFSINPTADKSHEQFTQLAIQQNGTAPAAAGSPPTTTSMPMPPPASSMPPPPPQQQAATSSGSPPPMIPSPSSPAPAPVAEMPAANPPANPAPAPATPAQLSAPPAAPANNNNNNNNNNMIAGSGTMANGQCSCSCLCGVGAFPAGAGVGMYGGFGGSVGGM